MGSYRLTRLIGSGGFAEVYLGEHLHLGTLAAIKVLHAQLADADTIEAFRTEARTIARLEHPHIIRLLDFGIEDDMPFFVMHYASHGSLRDRHSKGSILPLATIVSYIKQAADALQYAHNEKIIHRDVKPENMLLSHRNEIVLSDFGIAIEAHNTRSMILQHEAGTIPYMAPEQIQSKARPASDQYSLGVIVYEWLSGTHPFEGSYLQIATQHLLLPPPPLREKIPSILPSVEQIVMTALAKEPKHRFPTVQAFALALEKAWQDIEQLPVNVPHSISSILPPSSVSASRSQISEHSIQQSLSYGQTTAPLPPASFSKPPSPGTIPIVSQTALLSHSSLPLPDQQATSILSIQQQKEPQPSGTPLIGASYPLSPTVNLPIQIQLSSKQYSEPPSPHRPLQTTSAKNTYRRKGISLGLIALALVLIVGGVISYFSLGLSNNTSNSDKSNTSSIYHTQTATSSSSTLTAIAHLQQPVLLGPPTIQQAQYTEIANGSTTYTVTAQAVDKQSQPISSQGITCKLWLTQDSNVNANMPTSRLVAVDMLAQPFPKEEGVLNFAATTPQTQPCNSNGQGQWSYTISSSINHGTYYLVVLMDWGGIHYNWSWAPIVISH